MCGVWRKPWFGFSFLCVPRVLCVCALAMCPEACFCRFLRPWPWMQFSDVYFLCLLPASIWNAHFSSTERTTERKHVIHIIDVFGLADIAGDFVRIIVWRSRFAIFNVNPTLMCRKLNQMAIYKSLISKTKFSVIVGVPISIFFPFHLIFFVRSPRPNRRCDVIIKHKYECSRYARQCEKRFSILRITRVFNRCQWVVSRRIRQMGESGRV